MITDHDPLVSKYISVPKELHDLNIASWMAGVLQVFLFESGHVRHLLCAQIKIFQLFYFVEMPSISSFCDRSQLSEEDCFFDDF